MEEKLICKSKKSKYNVGFVIFGIILMIFVYCLINHNQPNPVGNEYYLKQIVTISFLIIILFCIFYLLNLKEVKVYKNHVEVNNLLKQHRIPYTEIAKLESLYIEGKYNSYTNHYIILKSSKKVRLTEEEYSNFDEFYNLIQKKVTK